MTSAETTARDQGSRGESAESRLPLVGEVIDGYRIYSRLGVGGMGAVYAAERDGERYAFKVMSCEDPAALARFEREAQALAAVDVHPNVVGIHAFSKSGRRPYLVLDLIEGRSLEDHIGEGRRFAVEEALMMLIKVADALQFIHDRRILHRDLKPGNILIRASDEEPFLTDFGLAKIVDRSHITSTNDVIGTPCYMAPEQLTGENERIAPTADVWALGAMLYELTTGSQPFRGSTNAALSQSILAADPESPRRLDAAIPRAVETIILKALSERPRDRYRTARAFADDCRRALEGAPVRARRLGWLRRAHRKVQRRYGISGLVLVYLLLLNLALIPAVLLRRARQEAAIQRWSGDFLAAYRPLNRRLEDARPGFGRHVARHILASRPRLMPSSLRGGCFQCRSSPAILRDFAALEAVVADAELHSVGDDYLTALISRADLAALRGRVHILARLAGLRSREGEPRAFTGSAAAILTAIDADDPAAARSAFERLTAEEETKRLGVFGLGLGASEDRDWERALKLLSKLGDDDEWAALVRPALRQASGEVAMTQLFAAEAGHAGLDRALKRFASLLEEDAERVERWRRWNAAVAARFAVIEPERGAAAYRRLEEARRLFSELRRPRLSRGLHLRLARAAEASGDDPEAFAHFLEVLKLSPDFELPERFRSEALSHSILNAFNPDKDDAERRRLFELILAMSRAGRFLVGVNFEWASRLVEAEHLDRLIERAPHDPSLRFWRALVRGARGDLRDPKLRRKVREELALAANNEDLTPLLRSLAFEQRGRLALRSRKRGAARQDLRAALNLGHPKPDRIERFLADCEESLEARLRRLIRARELTEDRFQKTLQGSLELGRPPACPSKPSRPKGASP